MQLSVVSGTPDKFTGFGLRVLVVGCEPSLVRYFCRFLRLYGYQVDKAFSASNAFRKSEAHPPDIAIVMTLMPEISGFDIGEYVSRQSQCGVIFVTAMDLDNPVLKENLCGLQVEGCKCEALPLPFENSDLLAMLQRLGS